MTIPVSVEITNNGIELVMTMAERGPTGPTGPAGIGEQGDPGVRGSLFLGSYPTESALPSVDGIAVLPGDYAYVADVGELWVAG